MGPVLIASQIVLSGHAVIAFDCVDQGDTHGEILVSPILFTHWAEGFLVLLVIRCLESHAQPLTWGVLPAAPALTPFRARRQWMSIYVQPTNRNCFDSMHISVAP